MIIEYLDEELWGLILKRKEINKSELSLKYNVDRYIISRHIKNLRNHQKGN